MFEDEQKLRLIAAAVKLQNIIAVFEIGLEYQALIDLCSSRTKTSQDEVQTLENANANPQVAGDAMLQSQLDDNGDLFTSLNQTIYNMGKLVDQINSSLNITRLIH